jgi:two-component system, cell cycle sensor histidine kinase and response regulator CckA
MPDPQRRDGALDAQGKGPGEQHPTEAHALNDGSDACAPGPGAVIVSPTSVATEQRIAELSERCRCLEEQLRHAQQMQTLGVIAGGIAHDFNNLLTGILGYAEMLKGELGASDKMREAAEVIESAAHQASQLTARLLTLVRGGHPHRIRVDVHQTLNQVVELLRRSSGRQVQIQTQFCEGAPTVTADTTQIFQVFLNLGLNARDALNGSGRIVFRTETVEQTAAATDEPRLAPGSYVLTTVEDTGQGIPEVIRHRIFEPFFTTKNDGQGTGMGLAVVQSIVNEHGGAVAVDSEPGRGSTFFVYLPASAANAAASPKLGVGIPLATAGAVLLVEEDALVRRTVTRMLTGLGYRVSAYPDVAPALAANSGTPLTADVVLLGFTDDPEDAARAIEAIRAADAEVAILVATATGCNEASERLARYDLAGFIEKPIPLARLAEAMDSAMKRRAAGSPVSPGA